MKISALAFFLLSKTFHFGGAQFTPDVIDVSFEVMKASENLENAAMSFQAEAGNFQPVCGHPVDNYITCISVEDDVDDTAFLVHPLVASGTKLKDLVGTSDYDIAKALIEAFVKAVTVRDCDETGNTGVATYEWLSETDSSSSVTVMSLVKDVMASSTWGQGDPDGDMSTKYICGTGPLTEAVTTLLGPAMRDGSFSMVQSSSKLAIAEKNLDKAISAIQQDTLEETQPNCVDPVRNYVSCFTTPEDVDETTFVAHPLVPMGTQIKDLKGTSDYDLGKNMVQALIDAVSSEGCEETGNTALASFDWLDSSDASTPIIATSFVKDFEVADDRRLRGRKLHETEKYLCSTGPLTPNGTTGVSDTLAATSTMITAADNIQNAISSFKSLMGDEQPNCVDPISNYVTCFDVQDNIDDITFIDHPLVPTGTTLGSLEGADYDLGKAKVEAFIAAISGCDETGGFSLANYQWLSATDMTTPVMVTSVVMDFEAPEGWWQKANVTFDDDAPIGRYICGSNPINESPLE